MIVKDGIVNIALTVKGREFASMLLTTYGFEVQLKSLSIISNETFLTSVIALPVAAGAGIYWCDTLFVNPNPITRPDMLLLF